MKTLYIIPLLFLSLLLACGSCKNKVQAQNEPLEGSWTLIEHYGFSGHKMYDFHKGSVVWTFKDNKLKIVVNKWEYSWDNVYSLELPFLAHSQGEYKYSSERDLITLEKLPEERLTKSAEGEAVLMKIPKGNPFEVRFEIKGDTLLIKVPSSYGVLVSKFLKLKYIQS